MTKFLIVLATHCLALTSYASDCSLTAVLEPAFSDSALKSDRFQDTLKEAISDKNYTVQSMIVSSANDPAEITTHYRLDIIEMRMESNARVKPVAIITNLVDAQTQRTIQSTMGDANSGLFRTYIGAAVTASKRAIEKLQDCE